MGLRHILIGSVTVGLAWSLILSGAHAVVRPLRPIEPLVGPDGIVCTTFSISDEGWWVSALHCKSSLQENPDAIIPFTIADMDATIIWELPDEDLMVLMTDVGVTGLPLAGTPPRIGDPVHLFGYGWGLPDGIYTEGLVAHLALDGLPGSVIPRLVVAMPVCRGESGAPIVDRHGQVISVFQALTAIPCAPFGFGLIHATLIRALGSIWPPSPPITP